jgi:hypothetical protein
VRHKLAVAVCGALFVTSLGLTTASRRPVLAQNQTAAVFLPNGKLKLPVGYRRWIFVGAPLTPNALNNGKASFPEFHHVYVEEKNLNDVCEGVDAGPEPDVSRRISDGTLRARLF